MIDAVSNYYVQQDPKTKKPQKNDKSSQTQKNSEVKDLNDVFLLYSEIVKSPNTSFTKGDLGKIVVNNKKNEAVLKKLGKILSILSDALLAAGHPLGDKAYIAARLYQGEMLYYYLVDDVTGRMREYKRQKGLTNTYVADVVFDQNTINALKEAQPKKK